MQEASIQLQCPACNETWTSRVSELPAPDATFACKECREQRPLSEHLRTARDLEVLREFRE